MPSSTNQAQTLGSERFPAFFASAKRISNPAEPRTLSGVSLSGAEHRRAAMPLDTGKRNSKAILQGVARALRSLNNGIAEEPLPPRLISLVERFENARKSQLEYLERQHRH